MVTCAKIRDFKSVRDSCCALPTTPSIPLMQFGRMMSFMVAKKYIYIYYNYNGYWMDIPARHLFEYPGTVSGINP